MEPEDAVELDRQRSIGEIIRAALGLYLRYPLLFLILAVAVIAPYQLFVLPLTGTGPLAHGTHRSFQMEVLLDLVDFSLVGPLISALHVHAVVLAGEGHRPRLVPVLVRGVRVLPVVAAAEIVANVGISLGMLALAVPGIILLVRWAVVAQTAAVDHEGWILALRRSWRLTSGNSGRILGLFLFIGSPVLAIHLGAIALPLGNTSGFTSVAFGIALDTVVASFFALTLAFLYFDLRAREANPHDRPIPEYQHVRDLD